MPEGAPLGLGPLLVNIELISNGARALSLGLRLFCNITSGHLLISILSGFAFEMCDAPLLQWQLAVASLFPILLTNALGILEAAIAGIQAYVFTLLTLSYIEEALHDNKPASASPIVTS
jgi:F-type H+-transporting ATPase subunit a